MLTAYALLKNLDSHHDELRFRNFTLQRIPQGNRVELERVQEIFPQARTRVTFGSWIYERVYQEPPPVLEGEHDVGFGRIPMETEDAILLLRLFKAGDICFCAQSLRLPDGQIGTQYPYWAMADINSTFPFTMEQNECRPWDDWAAEISLHDSWRSIWFRTSRRFFLSGGAKEFNLHWDLTDRIVDYMVVVEASLSTDNDYLSRQLVERTAAILRLIGPERDAASRLIKKFYSFRSTIAHGSQLSDAQKRYIRQNTTEFETLVRSILVAALRSLPQESDKKKAYLVRLFEVTDQDRSDKTYELFSRILSKKARARLLGRLLRALWR